MQLRKATLKGLILFGALAVATSAGAVVKVQPPGDGGNGGGTSQPAPSNEDAAGAVMCLTQLIAAGSKPVQCTKYVSRYFAVRDYTRGSFDPNATYKKRGKWLEKCTACRASDRQKVQDRFGRVMSL